MRWYWIDRYTEFVSGTRAVAQKAVSLGEEHLHNYFHGYPIMPPSLIVEGIAQTSGLLLAESRGYEAQIVLAKVSRSVFHFPVRPGQTLEYTTVIENQSREGALISGTSRVEGRVQAEVELYLAILGEKHGQKELFRPDQYHALITLLHVYKVAVSPEGERLTVPERLLPRPGQSEAAVDR